MTTDIYISADIEADGPIPGPYSMLAFGLAIASEFDGHAFTPRDPSAATFYRELKPISTEFDANALEIAQLDRDLLQREGAEPVDAMQAAATWIAEHTAASRPVLVAFPLAYDWMFLHWYFVRFLGESPFSFSHALDMKTIYQQKARVTVGEAGREDLPANLRSPRTHTHNALDDALEQADVFNNLFAWDGREQNWLQEGSP